MTALSLVLQFSAHLFADFIMQDRWIAENKSSNPLALSIHLLHHFLQFVAVNWPFFGFIISLKIAALNIIFHGLIDATTWNVYKYIRRDKKNDECFNPYKDSLFWKTLGVDQYLHACTIICVWYYMVPQ